MSNDKYKHLLRDGLEASHDHSASLEDDWSVLERRLERHDARKRASRWMKALGAVAATLLLLLTWQLNRDEALQPQRNQVTKKAPEKDLPAGGTVSPEDNVHLPDTRRRSQKGGGLPVREEVYAGRRPAFGMLQRLDLISGPDLSPAATDPVFLKAPEMPQVRQPVTPDLMVATAAEPKSSGPSLTLSFLYAPALNGVDNYKRVHVGSDMGVLLTLGLSKRWSLSTGAIYAKKLYDSDFDSYNPDNKASFPYTPDRIDADCRVLDLPLNLGYTLIDKGKNTLAIGTGISSYLMLREDYQFKYSRQSGLDDYNYSLKNKNKHAFSVLNLEARYQRRINSRLGLGVQPYLKVPLGGVGYGNIKLHSLGMAVNLNLSLGGKNENASLRLGK